MERKNQYYLELIKTITPEHLLPGVAELLNKLQTAGIRVAIGSASKNAREVVQRLSYCTPSIAESSLTPTIDCQGSLDSVTLVAKPVIRWLTISNCQVKVVVSLD